jgi:predicted anti-sigma-YlaC factor YlaD
MTMECDTYREQMSLWLDDQLTQEEMQLVEVHTATCPSCRAALEALRRVDRLLTSTPMASPAPGFTTRFQARLATRRRRHRTWVGLIILALATLTLTLGGIALLALPGLALWESFSASGVLTQSIGLLLDMGEAMISLLQVTWLILSALARGLRHPIFVAYAVTTAILAVVWTEIVARRVLAHRPVVRQS